MIGKSSYKNLRVYKASKGLVINSEDKKWK